MSSLPPAQFGRESHRRWYRLCRTAFFEIALRGTHLGRAVSCTAHPTRPGIFLNRFIFSRNFPASLCCFVCARARADCSKLNSAFNLRTLFVRDYSSMNSWYIYFNRAFLSAIDRSIAVINLSAELIRDSTFEL